MISIIKKDVITKDKFIGEFRGLSTDTKPIENVGNGSVFIEIDTGNLYFYDESTTTWKEV